MHKWKLLLIMSDKSLSLYQKKILISSQRLVIWNSKLQSLRASFEKKKQSGKDLTMSFQILGNASRCSKNLKSHHMYVSNSIKISIASYKQINLTEILMTSISSSSQRLKIFLKSMV